MSKSNSKKSKRVPKKHFQYNPQFIFWMDYGFFVLAGLASLWLAWFVFREALATGGWSAIFIFVLVWAITAYLALPRLHRILTSIYVPDYFIGRNRTPDGLLGGPVNLAFRGSEEQIHKVMKAAGWSLADEITPKTTWRMILSTLRRQSYPKAPISTLMLFGRRQDFAYQQEVQGNPRKRHHVRFWRCPEGWLLRGGHQADWLAAGIYDKSVSLSLFTFQFTHRVDEDTDAERDYIVKTVLDKNRSVKLKMINSFLSGYYSRNGGGHSIKTDGNLPVLELQKVKFKDKGLVSRVKHLILDKTVYDQPPEEHESLLRELWGRRPPQILLGFVFLTMILAVATIDSIKSLVIRHNVDFAAEQLSANSAISENLASRVVIGSIILSFAVIILEFVLAIAVLHGSYRSRIALLILVSMAIITEAFSVTIRPIDLPVLGILMSIGLHIAVVLSFSSDAARLYTKVRSNIKH